MGVKKLKKGGRKLPEPAVKLPADSCFRILERKIEKERKCSHRQPRRRPLAAAQRGKRTQLVVPIFLPKNPK